MEKLFGIPLDRLMIALIVIFVLSLVAGIVVALRRLVVFRMAVRNIPRRRAQTALIVLGLMLATVLFSASLATGDTLTHSIRTDAVKRLGEVDIVVRVTARDASGRLAYFGQDYLDVVRDAVAENPDVDGVAPLIQERAPVVDPATRLSEPVVEIMGIDGDSMAGFDSLVAARGEALSLSTLEEGQTYVSIDLAGKLEAKEGDTVQVYLGPEPLELVIAGIYEKGANPAGELSLALPLDRLQASIGAEGYLNSILISNHGGPIDGADHTYSVLSSVRPALDGTGLEAADIKQAALKRADAFGANFSSLFLLFGQFSIAAGVLLIFLIFVMLAAERKRELGIARAVGMQRGHVIELFAFEGAVYALLAAAVGSLLGVAVGWGMVRIMTIAFGQMDLKLTYALNWRSVIIAYTMGLALTFAVVLVSSWRVSRLNIVRAIRDLPEPRSQRRSIWSTLLVVAILVAGGLLTFSALRSGQAAPWMAGTSLVIIGVPMLARRLGLADRAAFTIAGAGLVVWWLLPQSVTERIIPDMKLGIDVFFISGVMVVLGAVWMVIYNADLLVTAIVWLFGRIRGLPPMLKTAISYTMRSRFRTGITLAMFSMVVFTLVVMSFVLQSLSALYTDTERLSGGFDVRASTSLVNPIRNIHDAIAVQPDLDPNDFAAIGSVNAVRLKVKQADSERKAVDYYVQGVDTEYGNAVFYDFALKADGYDSAAAVWQALQDEPGTAIVSQSLVPTRTDFELVGGSPSLMLEGFWLEDGELPLVFLQVANPYTGTEVMLRVIGVLGESAVYAPNVITSQDMVNRLAGRVMPPVSYMFRLNEGVDAESTARALETGFLEHGLQAEVMADEILREAGTSLMIISLMQGFMGLGLIVGIAALGVIAARAVVERRQQIGILRALGFQRRMVQGSFLLESSFVALLGIGLGVALGAGVATHVIGSMSKTFDGLTFEVPWLNLAEIIAIAYLASLLTTFLPARQASRIYPAEALRFE